MSNIRREQTARFVPVSRLKTRLKLLCSRFQESLVKIRGVNHPLQSFGGVDIYSTVLLWLCSEDQSGHLSHEAGVCASVRGHAAVQWKTHGCEKHAGVFRAVKHQPQHTQTHARKTHKHIRPVWAWRLWRVLGFHREFTLLLWYYPIQPVWPSGNPLISSTQRLKLFRRAADTVQKHSNTHTHQ